jgi:hypothetical protein
MAVDAAGEPDPMHAILDIAASLQHTPLGGDRLAVVGAAVVGDKLFLALPAWLLMCALLS